MAETVSPATDAAAAQMPFDARVEGFWQPLKDPRHPLGFFESWRKKRRLTALLRTLNAGIAAQEAAPGAWDQKQADPICNLRIDRLGVLQDLRTFAAHQDNQSATEVFEGAAESRFLHLIKNRDRTSYYVPVDFAEPLMIHDPDTHEMIPVGSGPRLLRELALLNKTLRVQETFQIKKMVDFLQATSKDLARYEANFAHDPLFWVKFGFILLDKLARKSAESGLPIVFA